MRKLNKAKIAWIIRWSDRLSAAALAESQRVSPRRVRQILRQYRLTGEPPVLRSPGRPPTPILPAHRRLVMEEYERQRGNALVLERTIFAKHHIRIPHNRIHRILKEAGMAKTEPKKSKRRKWVRYERKHSLSLLHTDWHESRAMAGKWVIAYEDDASRCILACDEYDEATARSAIRTLDRALDVAAPYGGVRQLLTDRGGQFYANRRDKKGRADHPYERHVAAQGIDHIKGRAHHPQTNGKQEKWFDCYERHRERFATLREFVGWYNEERAHMSLNLRRAETPAEAFIRKMDPTVWVGWWIKGLEERK